MFDLQSEKIENREIFLDLNKKFITIMQYPVTTEFEKSQFQIEETLKLHSKMVAPKCSQQCIKTFRLF